MKQVNQMIEGDRKVKVLMADNSLLILDALSRLLTHLDGISIVSRVQTVEKAIEAIKSCQPDIVILDFRFPKNTCLDILWFLKKSEYDPVVMIYTHNAQRPYLEICKRLGAHFFFKKLEDTYELKQQLQLIIRNKLKEYDFEAKMAEL